MTEKSQDFLEAYHQANLNLSISEEIVTLSLQFETNHSQWLDKPATAENTAAFLRNSCQSNWRLQNRDRPNSTATTPKG